MDRHTAANIDEYISWCPVDVRKILTRIRSTIKKSAPNAEESISYQIPTYKIDGKVLIYFAAFSRHVSVYPAPRDAPKFEIELGKYKGKRHYPVSARFPDPV